MTVVGRCAQRDRAAWALAPLCVATLLGCQPPPHTDVGAPSCQGLPTPPAACTVAATSHGPPAIAGLGLAGGGFVLLDGAGTVRQLDAHGVETSVVGLPSAPGGRAVALTATGEIVAIAVALPGQVRIFFVDRLDEGALGFVREAILLAGSIIGGEGTTAGVGTTDRLAISPTTLGFAVWAHPTPRGPVAMGVFDTDGQRLAGPVEFDAEGWVTEATGGPGQPVLLWGGAGGPDQQPAYLSPITGQGTRADRVLVAQMQLVPGGAALAATGDGSWLVALAAGAPAATRLFRVGPGQAPCAIDAVWPGTVYPGGLQISTGQPLIIRADRTGSVAVRLAGAAEDLLVRPGAFLAAAPAPGGFQVALAEPAGGTTVLAIVCDG